MSSPFSYELRVLLCPQCGAPVEVWPRAGASPCRFCGAHAEVGVRDERLDLVLRPERQPIAEAERLSRLWTQKNALRQDKPPGGIAHLFGGDNNGLAGARLGELHFNAPLAPWRLAEAVSVWQAARKEAQATAQPDASETTYLLAMALLSVYVDQDEIARQRAVVESSLEALRLPRHRQALRCVLARLACRSEDLSSAEQWLAPCDPASDDIEMDTPYRLTRAVIATARGDWREVLQMLGRRPGDAPTLSDIESLAVVFRANALERMGDVDGAATLLSDYENEIADPWVIDVRTRRLEKAFEYWAPLRLCAESRAARSRRGVSSGAVRPMSRAVVAMFVVGGLLMLPGGALLVAGVHFDQKVLTGGGVAMLAGGYLLTVTGVRRRRAEAGAR